MSRRVETSQPRIDMREMKIIERLETPVNWNPELFDNNECKTCQKGSIVNRQFNFIIEPFQS